MLLVSASRSDRYWSQQTSRSSHLSLMFSYHHYYYSQLIRTPPSYILTVTSHVCLTIDDDNIQYTHVLPPCQGATTTTTITAACFYPSFDTEQQRSENLPSPIRFLSDHRSIPMNSVRIRVRQAALRNQLWEELSSEKEIKVTLPYRTVQYSSNRSDYSDRI